MKRNYSGCAICDSTWGNLWEDVEGERMFFCCDVCLTQFRRLVDRVKRETGWSAIEALEIEGDRRGRRCLAASGEARFRFRIAFNSLGEIRAFERLAVG
ncbi:MAG: TA0938 family protein [Thermoplasmata archaeon]|nr:TA0938 family protein [Thermoplasmata archaeon]